MQEVVLKLTLEQFQAVMNALNASVQWQQQNTAVLMASLQGQMASQVQPLNQVNQAAALAQGVATQGGQLNVGSANVQPA